MSEKHIPERVEAMLARLRARSKPGNQSGAEKPSQPVDGRSPFDPASDTALGANAPIRVCIDSASAGLKMTIRNQQDRRFVHEFLREIAT